MLITMPSGFAGEIRGLKVRDLQQIADPSMARGGKALDVMLSAFSAITALGPYEKKWAIGGVPKWDDALQGDVFAALIDIRAATWGAEYEFRVRCQGCGEGYDWELDLRDIPRKPYPETTIEALRQGEPEFTTEGPGGEPVRFKLTYRRDEKIQEERRRRAGGKFGIADALGMRLVSVEGVKDVRLKDWILELEAAELKALVERMQEHEGGVDTDIETVCTFCNWQQWVSLPFDKGFYYPTKKKPMTSEPAPAAVVMQPGTPLAPSSPAKRTG